MMSKHDRAPRAGATAVVSTSVAALARARWSGYAASVTAPGN
jgi:hypothetical protein